MSSPACARRNRSLDLKKRLPKALRRSCERIRTRPRDAFQGCAGFRVHHPGWQSFSCCQTRNGKRTGVAAVKFACDMVREKLIDWKTAIMRVPADQLDQVLAPVFDRNALKSAKAIAERTSGRPWRGHGQRFISTPIAPPPPRTRARRCCSCGSRRSPEDLRGMIAAEGIPDRARRC